MSHKRIINFASLKKVKSIQRQFYFVEKSISFSEHQSLAKVHILNWTAIKCYS